ncbi:unnamed protein product, partial [Nesidiocoris tenuis]
GVLVKNIEKLTIQTVKLAGPQGRMPCYAWRCAMKCALNGRNLLVAQTDRALQQKRCLKMVDSA